MVNSSHSRPANARPSLARRLSPALAVAAFALPVALLLGAAPASAIARSTIAYTCRGGNPEMIDADTLETDFAASAGCNVSATSPLGSIDAVAQGLTTFGFPAAADAQTAIMVHGGNSTAARLVAQVRFNVSLAPLAPPPVEAMVIPIRVTAPYSMSGLVEKEPGVGGGSGANVSLTVGASSTFDQIGTSGSGSNSFSRDGTLVVTELLGWPVFSTTVWINARCQSEASAVSINIIADCQAVIDPFFEFDQAAFDAQMGEDSFPLADYFIFRLNENLGQPPLPPDVDRDGIGNALDNCPYFPNPDLADANANGIGNACECGDQNADGRVNVSDLIAINLAIFNPSLVTPLCDTDNDGDCNVADIVGANLKIFGRPAYCSRYPYPVP